MASQIARMLLLLLAVAACGGDNSVEATTTSTPPTSVADTSTTTAPVTSVTTPTTVAETTSTTILDPEQLLGPWLVESAEVILTFRDDGTHTVGYAAGDPFDVGPYEVEGNRITFISAEGSEVCGPEPGVYEVAVIGDRLDFTWVSDGCAERTDIVGGVVRFEP